MTSRQSSFVDRVYRAAIRSGLNEVQAALAATQAALETGYGKSIAGNNLFGIKAGTSWAGETKNVATREQGADGLYSTRDDFRAYDNFEDSLRDYIAFIEQNYPDAWNASTFDDAVAGLDSGRYGAYATDEGYGGKLRYINNRFVEPVPVGIALSNLSTIPVPARRGVSQAHAADQMAPRTAPPGSSDYPTSPLDPAPWVDDDAPAPAPAEGEGSSVGFVEAGTPPVPHTYDPESLNRIPVPRARPTPSTIPVPTPAPGRGAGLVPTRGATTPLDPYASGPKQQIFDFVLGKLLNPGRPAK